MSEHLVQRQTFARESLVRQTRQDLEDFDEEYQRNRTMYDEETVGPARLQLVEELDQRLQRLDAQHAEERQLDLQAQQQEALLQAPPPPPPPPQRAPPPPPLQNAPVQSSRGGVPLLRLQPQPPPGASGSDRLQGQDHAPSAAI